MERDTEKASRSIYDALLWQLHLYHRDFPHHEAARLPPPAEGRPLFHGVAVHEVDEGHEVIDGYANLRTTVRLGSPVVRGNDIFLARHDYRELMRWVSHNLTMVPRVKVGDDHEARFRAALKEACREVFGRYTPEPKIRAVGDRVWPVIDPGCDNEIMKDLPFKPAEDGPHRYQRKSPLPEVSWKSPDETED